MDVNPLRFNPQSPKKIDQTLHWLIAYLQSL
jgi:hypothetical protein